MKAPNEREKNLSLRCTNVLDKVQALSCYIHTIRSLPVVYDYPGWNFN